MTSPPLPPSPPSGPPNSTNFSRRKLTHPLPPSPERTLTLAWSRNCMGDGLAPAPFQYTSGEAFRRRGGLSRVVARERHGAVEPVGLALGLGPPRRAVALDARLRGEAQLGDDPLRSSIVMEMARGEIGEPVRLECMQD